MQKYNQQRFLSPNKSKLRREFYVRSKKQFSLISRWWDFMAKVNEKLWIMNKNDHAKNNVLLMILLQLEQDPVESRITNLLHKNLSESSKQNVRKFSIRRAVHHRTWLRSSSFRRQSSLAVDKTSWRWYPWRTELAAGSIWLCVPTEDLPWVAGRPAWSWAFGSFQTPLALNKK